MKGLEKFWQDAEEFNLATGITACAEIILADLTPLVERAEVNRFIARLCIESTHHGVTLDGSEKLQLAAHVICRLLMDSVKDMPLAMKQEWTN
jgi:hypothetical protein